MEENTEEVLEEVQEEIENNENSSEENENSQENEGNEEVNKQDKTARIKQELEDVTDTLQRVRADYENYKKRNEKERAMLYKSLIGDIMLSFLPIIDNLEKAVETKTEDEGYKQGIELILKQFLDVLKAQGVEVIKTVGERFDPEIHEAISSVVDDTLGEKIVKEEFRKGYMIGTKVIRHAMVSVAN